MALSVFWSVKVALVPLLVFELALDYLVPSLVADLLETLLAADLQETLLVFG